MSGSLVPPRQGAAVLKQCVLAALLLFLPRALAATATTAHCEAGVEEAEECEAGAMAVEMLQVRSRMLTGASDKEAHDQASAPPPPAHLRCRMSEGERGKSPGSYIRKTPVQSVNACKGLCLDEPACRGIVFRSRNNEPDKQPDCFLLDRSYTTDYEPESGDNSYVSDKRCY